MQQIENAIIYNIIQNIQNLNQEIIKKNFNNLENSQKDLVEDNFHESSNENINSNKREKNFKNHSNLNINESELLENKFQNSEPEKEDSSKEDENKPPKNEPNRKKHKEKEAKLQFSLYILLWAIYFYLGFLIPLNLFFLYIIYIFIPKFILIGYPRDWVTWWYIFKDPIKIFNAFSEVIRDPVALTVFMTSPLVFVGIYIFKLFCDATVMKFYLWLCNKIRPRRQLINAPPRGDTAPDVMMYHTRNFLLRIIKWEFSRCPFPWLIIWMFNYIGSNKLGKGTTIEDGFICCEYLETGRNVYIGFGSITSSHLVEGIYGALTVKKVKLNDNVVIGSRCAIPPGTEMGDNSQVLWNSAVLKFQKMKENTNYWGLPVSKLTDIRYKKLIKLISDSKETKE